MVWLGLPVDPIAELSLLPAAEVVEDREDVMPASGLSVPDLHLEYEDGHWIFVEAK